MKLKGKTAVVTGAARGIGLTIAEYLANEGAEVYAADISKGESANPNIHFVELDVTDRATAAKLAEDLSKKGNIDILVNNAGISSPAFIQEMTMSQWNKVIAIDLTGVFNVTQAVAPVMMENGSGSIINIASIVGVYGDIAQSNYTASKAGVIGMAKGWAKEFARKGAQVRANSIAPGVIKTPMTKDISEKTLDGMVAKTPLGRMGEPEDIAKAVVFLASDDASFITGQCLGVDGGIVI